MEVWLLKVEYAPDWPSTGGWMVDGIYANSDLVIARIEELKEDPFFKSFEYKCYEVKQAPSNVETKST